MPQNITCRVRARALRRILVELASQPPYPQEDSLRLRRALQQTKLSPQSLDRVLARFESTYHERSPHFRTPYQLNTVARFILSEVTDSPPTRYALCTSPQVKPFTPR